MKRDKQRRQSTRPLRQFRSGADPEALRTSPRLGARCSARAGRASRSTGRRRVAVHGSDRDGARARSRPVSPARPTFARPRMRGRRVRGMPARAQQARLLGFACDGHERGTPRDAIPRDVAPSSLLAAVRLNEVRTPARRGGSRRRDASRLLAYTVTSPLWRSDRAVGASRSLLPGRALGPGGTMLRREGRTPMAHERARAGSGPLDERSCK